MRRRSIVTGLATAAALSTGLAVGLPGTAAAAGHTVHAAFTCSNPQGYANVAPDVDWLKVHTSEGTGTPSVGQLKRGAAFCILRTSKKVVNGYHWQYGYGYNGKKLTGYVAAELLIYP